MAYSARKNCLVSQIVICWLYDLFRVLNMIKVLDMIEVVDNTRVVVDAIVYSVSTHDSSLAVCIAG